MSNKIRIPVCVAIGWTTGFLVGYFFHQPAWVTFIAGFGSTFLLMKFLPPVN